MTGLALSTTFVVGNIYAQTPGQNPGQNRGAGCGGGVSGVAGLRPFITGTIVTGDASAGTITIASQNGSTQIIHVGQDTKIYAQTTIKASELRVGDKLFQEYPGAEGVVVEGSLGNIILLAIHQVGIRVALAEAFQGDLLLFGPCGKAGKLGAAESGGFRGADGLLIEDKVLDGLIPGKGVKAIGI